MSKLLESLQLAPFPWISEARPDLKVCRPVMILGEPNVANAYMRGCGALPRRCSNDGDLAYHRFEPPSELLREPYRVRQTMEDGHSDELEEDATPCVETEWFDDELRTSLSAYVELIDSLCETTHERPKAVAWESVREGKSVRSLNRVLSRVRRTRSTDHPPLSLVVRLSSKLPKILNDITTNPRRILTRDREQLPLHQLRETDARCVEWLAKQPGRTIREKAGHRRRALGVVRYETADTVENRVTLDLMKRCHLLCLDYCRSHEKRFPNHPRVEQVRRFGELCARLPMDSTLVGVSKLHSRPAANYVLLYETRYRVIWKAYQQVIGLQDRMDVVHLWYQRAWAEAWQVAFWEQLDLAVGRTSARRGHLWLRDQPVAGKFLSDESPPGAFTDSKSARFWLANSDLDDPSLPAAIHVHRGFDPDWLLSCHSKGEKRQERELCGWCAVASNEVLQDVRASLMPLAVEMAKQVHRKTTSIIVLGMADQSEPKLEASVDCGSVAVELWIWPLDVIRTSIDLSASIERWCGDS